MLPDFERADRIGEFWGNPKTRTFAELLIDCEEDRTLQASDPAAANSAWIEIEHQLVEDAIWVPLTNHADTYAFSARTENVQVHPQWGVLVSRLWVQ